MHRAIALLTALMACGYGREHNPGTPSSGDAGRIVRAPALIDAGTGNCVDDFDATRTACGAIDAGGEDQILCALAVVDAFEACLGPAQTCRERCTRRIHQIEDSGVPASQQISDATAACIALCPALDAG